jgi:hypothetical protein
MRKIKTVLVILCTGLLVMTGLSSCGGTNAGGSTADRGSAAAVKTTVAETRSPYAPEKDFTFDNGTITGYSGPGGELHIPPQINKTDVTAIGKEAFRKKETITAVYLPESVKEIGENAFRLCEKMTTFDFSHVQKIGAGAFENCPLLMDVKLPETCTEIGEESFMVYSQSNGGKADNGKLFIPKSLTSIPAKAFSCSRFKTIEFESDTLPAFGKEAFSDSGDFKVIMPKTVKQEDAEKLQDAFKNAGGFTGQKLFYPDGKEIKVVYENYTDRYKYNQTDTTVTIISYIGKETDVKVPSKIEGKKVVEILDDAFRGKESIKTITIGDGIEKFGASICYQCPNLEKITLPDSVKEVGDMFCHACPKLKEVKWSAKADIPKQAFDGCTALTSFTVPDGVKSIGDNAFDGCSALKTVSLGKVEKIGQMAFDACGLTKIDVPGTVKDIPYCGFTKCLYVEEIRLESGVETIGDSAFYLCGTATRKRGERPGWIVRTKDPSRYPSIVQNDPENPHFVDIYLPGTLKKVAHGAFSDMFINGLWMTDVKKPEDLPVFEAGAFSGLHYINQIYFEKAVIDEYGTQLDDYFKQFEEVGDRCWYDAGKRMYWSTEEIPSE